MNVFILLFLFIVVTCQAYLTPFNTHLVARQGIHDPTHNNPEFKELKEKAKHYVFDDAVNSNSKHLFPLEADVHMGIIQDSYKLKPLQSGDPDNKPESSVQQLNHLRHYIPTPSRFNNHYVYQNSYPVVSSRSPFNQVNNPDSDLVSQHQYNNPADHTKSLIKESVQRQKEAQAEQAALLQQFAKSDREARLEAVDDEALRHLSEDDRNILQSKLTLSEREELLDQLESGDLDEILPREENRFGGFGTDGFAAQIGASAGKFIGGKLAGALGAKLGAAAGAYLGAAAASRLVQKKNMVSNIVSNISNMVKDSDVKYDYGGGYGAVLVKSE